MTILMLWLLLYPLVSAACVVMYAYVTDADVGRLNAGYAVAYILGTILLTVIYYV